ncbi:MAG: MCP four helix bundle domain-containing protein, partial [Burkholderiaceae bacterium]
MRLTAACWAGGIAGCGLRFSRGRQPAVSPTLRLVERALTRSSFIHAAGSTECLWPSPAHLNATTDQRTQMRWTTGKRISLLLATLGLGVVVIVGIAWQRLSVAERVLESTVSRLVPQIDRMTDIRLNVLRISLEARQAMLVETEVDRTAALKLIGELRRKIEQDLKDFEKAISSAEGAARFQKVKTSVADFDQAV